MVARCRGNDRYYPMVDGLFETQKTWAVPGAEGKEKLLHRRQAGRLLQGALRQCLADKELFDKIVEVRQRGHEKFGVDSTPTFFINGKRLRGGQDIKEFETMLAGGRIGGSARRRPRPLGFAPDDFAVGQCLDV